jgi:crotonobetainyl-CoA:carnitine CoA-transferase CaiB-like acyl-CoA transferase
MVEPCNGLRIVDLGSGRAAGIATMVLADYGADIIKVEPPGGDPGRHTASWPLWLRGKRSVVLDLTQPAGQAALHDLVRGADVVVSSYAAGEAEPFQADYTTLSRLNRGLVYCSLSAWGLHGPYAHWPAHDEALVAAKAGRFWQFEHVTRREGPTFVAVQAGTHAASQAAVAGILAALHVRERTGEGQLVETSILQGMIPFELDLLREQMLRSFPERMAAEPMVRSTSTSLSSLGYQLILTKDGRWLQFANLLEHLFHAAIIQMGLGEAVFGNPRYAGAPLRLSEEAREEIRDLMLRRAREKTADEWMELFRQSKDVAADFVGSTQQALYHPDLVANGEVVEQQHPTLGPVRMAGPVVKLRETPGRAGNPAPSIGQHTEQVLTRPPWEPRGVRAASPDSHPPLAGLTVLELATIVATPLACSMIGDLGARVIKVEPIEGDPGRGLARHGGFGSYVNSTRLNQSKESICLDLKTADGQAIVRELIKQADFIIHNYRPGVPERLAIGYEQARAIKPDIIWIHASCYGVDGPSAFRPGAQPIAGAVNGSGLWQAGAGWPPPPTDDLTVIREASRHYYRANAVDPDPNTAMAVQTAALLALRARQLTGRGQQVFVNMLSANQYANADDAVSYAGKRERPVLDEWVYGTGPLRRLYRAREGWVCLSAEHDDQFAAFCAATGRPQLACDARFADAAARADHGAELATELAALFATESAGYWERQLVAAGVGCVQADTDRNTGQFWLRDEQVRANGLAPTAHHLVLGDYQRWGPMLTFEKNPCVCGDGVIAGEHTDAILAELGYGEAQIADLRGRKIVWTDEQALQLAIVGVPG